MKKVKKGFNALVMSFVLVCCSVFNLSAAAPAEDELIMKGNVQARIFADFVNANTNGNNANSFELQRSYFGYAYQFTKKWSAKTTLDVGATSIKAPNGETLSSGLDRIAYLKQAYVQYANNGLRLRFGLENTLAFDEIESFWGHRYIMKTFQDQNSWSSSADFGMTALYQFNKMISLDASVMNGEGYKQLKSDSTLRYSVGLSLTPIKGLKARVYFDSQNKDGAQQQDFSAFLGYKTADFFVGGQYDMINNKGNKMDKNYTGLSFYGGYTIGEVADLGTLGLFIRYDKLSSKDDFAKNTKTVSDWNSGLGVDNSTFVFGVECTPVKAKMGSITFSPNMRYVKPDAEGSKAATFIMASMYIDIK